MADWSDIEDALRTWVKTSTSLADSQVYFAEQDGARAPSGNFITVRLGDIRTLGPVDETQTTSIVPGAPGADLRLTSGGPREFTVTLQCFSPDKVSDTTARTLLARCQSGLGLQSVRYAFETAGFSAFDKGTVQNITYLNGTKFEGRAILEIRCYAYESVDEVTTWIENVDTTSYIGPPGTLDEIDI